MMRVGGEWQKIVTRRFVVDIIMCVALLWSVKCDAVPVRMLVFTAANHECTYLYKSVYTVYVTNNCSNNEH